MLADEFGCKFYDREVLSLAARESGFSPEFFEKNDERKGFLKTGGKAEMELTFHLDHIFGSSKAAATDAMNTGARGFEPFAKGGKQALSLKNLHVGHTGEGHCNVQWH